MKPSGHRDGAGPLGTAAWNAAEAQIAAVPLSTPPVSARSSPGAAVIAPPREAARKGVPRPGWRRFALRGALTQGLCLAVAVVYFLADPRAASFGVTWLYSVAIGNACWLFIDGARTAGLLLAARYLERPTSAARWPGLAWLMVCIGLGAPAGFAVGHRLVDALLGHRTGSLFADRSALVVSLIAALGASAYFFVGERLHLERAAAESARRIAAEHELKLLESQLEPHMLFNTLANLRVLIALDPPRAQAMLDRLVAFLRAMLGASRAGAHPLADEFARIGDYLELMQVRMGNRLRTVLTLPADLAGVPVPPFLLQPLVENAIRHGLEPQVAGGRIDISAAREAGQLVLRVRDTGVGSGTAPAPSSGVGAHFGLAQVRERLASLHGAAASLDLAPAADAEGGMLATIRLPL